MPNVEYNPNSLSDFKKMWEVLNGDVSRCHQQLTATKGSKEEEFWRRVYARAIFACIEGASDSFKNFAFFVERAKSSRGILQTGKLSILSGKEYFLDEGGKIKERTYRPNFLSDMLFSLQAFQEAVGATRRTVKGDKWHHIKSAVCLRHRVTHPKQLSDLEISHDESFDLWYTYGWFLQEVTATFSEAGQVIPVPGWEKEGSKNHRKPGKSKEPRTE